MAVSVIGTLEPKNNGDFPVVKAEDVWLDDGTTVEEKLSSLTSGGETGGGETTVDFVKVFEDALASSK